MHESQGRIAMSHKRKISALLAEVQSTSNIDMGLKKGGTNADADLPTAKLLYIHATP